MTASSWRTKVGSAFWVALMAVVVIGVWVTRAGARWPSIYYMTGQSMEPTVAPNEHYVAWSPVPEISRGDLVLFLFSVDDEVFHVLRRVAALPGDTVSMDSGLVVVNTVPQSAPYRIVRPEASRSPLAIEENLYTWGPWVVPAESTVLLSDTRDILGWPDSRFIGFVAIEDIVARATRTLKGRRLR